MVMMQSSTPPLFISWQFFYKEEFSSLDILGDARIQGAMDKWRNRVRLNMSEAPVVEFFAVHEPRDLMAEMTKFLKFASTFASL